MTRPYAADALLSIARQGRERPPALVCATVQSIEELDALRKGLSEQGRLDTDWMAAIRDRMDALHARGQR